MKQKSQERDEKKVKVMEERKLGEDVWEENWIDRCYWKGSEDERGRRRNADAFWFVFGGVHFLISAKIELRSKHHPLT